MFTAKDLMATRVISADPDDTVQQVVSSMLDHALSVLPVVDRSDHLLGIVSEFDLLELINDPNTASNPVRLHMTRDVFKVSENTELSEVVECFHKLLIRRLPVMRGDRLVGIISRRDLFRCVVQARVQLHVAGHKIPAPHMLAAKKARQRHSDQC